MNKEDLIVARDGDISLRLMTIADTDKILKWRNSPYVVKNFIFREPITEEMHEDWIRTMVNEGKVVQFICADGEIEVGSIYYRDIDEKCENAEFGIFMDEAYAGKGLGTRLTKLSLKYMFEEFGFKTISLRVLEKNLQASHIYEKCGFKFLDKNEIAELDGKEETIRFMLLSEKDFCY